MAQLRPPLSTALPLLLPTPTPNLPCLCQHSNLHEYVWICFKTSTINDNYIFKEEKKLNGKPISKEKLKKYQI